MTENELKAKILKLFVEHQGEYVSGEAMSRTLGISRAYIWKGIKSLREEGFEFDASRNKGYVLMKRPDKLFAYNIPISRSDKYIKDLNIIHFEKIDSTNNKAYELASSGVPNNSVVIAEKQTKGKGRLGRTWVSPTSTGIYASLIIRPDLEPDEIPAITLVAALAVTEAIRECTGLEASVKWPNDVMYKNKKLCGILTEMKADSDNVDFLVLGLGVNVNTPGSKLPETGTSISVEIGSKVDRAELFKTIFTEFLKRYEIMEKEGFSALRNECKKVSSVLNREIKIEEHKRLLKGKAVDIDEKGALILLDSNGDLVRVFSGDVTVGPRV
jgi:BirA family transcriptional regulator, biotin operon repressor / biotin---[acetyl-CoA-carboxylase] ligase